MWIFDILEALAKIIKNERASGTVITDNEKKHARKQE